MPPGARVPVTSARHASRQRNSNAAPGGSVCPPDVELDVVRDVDDLVQEVVLGVDAEDFEDVEDFDDAADVVDVVDFLVETSVVALSLSARA